MKRKRRISRRARKALHKRHSGSRRKPSRSSKRRCTRSNPGKPVFDKQGGVYPQTTFQLIRAKVADLGTLPNNLCGTSCGSCRYFVDGGDKVGYCKHPLLQLPVTHRQCCAFWDRSGFLRPTKAVSG